MLNRREFLALSAASAAAVAAGCATNPVTGRRQLMLVTESDELDLDRANSPHQFSADYGPTQDAELNRYIESVGGGIGAVAHRQMPYSFRVVNAAYVNAYAFPGGSIAATRGILLHLENEAELAALLGHEVGHVSARHTGQQMTKTMMTMAVVAGLTIYAQQEMKKYAPIAAGLGQVGAGMLLARYSRDNEREADALALEYMTKAGYSPEGCVGLMKMLKGLSDRKSSALELLFATHPMSSERYDTALRQVETQYADRRNLPLHRERFMDNTAALRRLKPALDAMQNGDEALMAGKMEEARTQYQIALREAPDDYAALLMMAKCCLALGKPAEAESYAEHARDVYPEEAQSYHIGGLLKLNIRRYDGAYRDFSRYEQILPGNPNTTFFKGLSLEKMGRREAAAEEYVNYLQQAPSGEHAAYVRSRLAEWGYVRGG